MYTELLEVATYYRGDAIGHVLAYVLLGLMLITWLWVMFKYLDSRNLDD